MDNVSDSLAPVMTLQQRRITLLGSDVGSTAASVATARIGGSAIAVVDAAGRLLRVYDRDGRPRYTVSIGAGPTAKMRVPHAIALVGDTVWALDISPKRGLAVVIPPGDTVQQMALPATSSTYDIAPVGGNLAIAVVQPTRANNVLPIVQVVTRRGQVVGNGCQLDPRYHKSDEKQGIIGMFRGMGVTTFNARLYCRQAITPIVQVLDSVGRALGSISVAPPFYHAPTDAPSSMNVATVNKFRSSWWEHRQFFPTATGFVSIYASYDSMSQNNRYRAFACDSAAGIRKCGVADVPGTPIEFLPPDTIVTAMPRTKATERQAIAFLTIPR
jgi:hypothetical protein